MSAAPLGLEFSIGYALRDGSTILLLQGETVLCGIGESPLFFGDSAGPSDDPVVWHEGPARSVPSEEQWERFNARLDAIGVWEWESDYYDDSVLDGSTWAFRVDYPDRTIRVMGTNGYPDGHGGVSPKPAGPYRSLLRALSELSGAELPR